MKTGPGFTAAVFIQGGQLFLRNFVGFQDLVRRMRDGDYELTLAAHVETRSDKLNKYYHGIVVAAVADYTGYDHADAHELLKLKCNPKIIINHATGEEETIGGSTVLPTAEFQAYCERCKWWAAEHCDGLYIPDPNEFEVPPPVEASAVVRDFKVVGRT